MAILDPKIETAAREVLRQIQIERLQATLNRAYRHVALYREKFDAAQILPEDVCSLQDLARLPCTTREDLLQHQPFGLFAVPLRDVLRLHPSAGAGGPIVVGYTANDIGIWTRMAARALTSAGVTKDDVIQISLDYALNAAGMGAQSGAEFLGASVIPSSGLAPKRQAELLYNYRATVLVATPSQALHLGPILGEVNRASLSLRCVFIVGQAWSDLLREEIRFLLGVEVFGSYGLSEMAVPGLASECEHHNGLHLTEDNILAETLDPKTLEPVPPGQPGELVLTALTREAVPLIRYRTGDITILHEEECPCGRTMVRMEPTQRRSDDIVIVNGVRVAPHQVEDVVHDILSGAECALSVAKHGEGEELEVRIGIDPSRFEDEMRHMQTLRDHVKVHILEHLGLRANVRFVERSRKKN